MIQLIDGQLMAYNGGSFIYLLIQQFEVSKIMSKPASVILLLVLFVWASYSFDKLDNHQQIMAYYQENSYMPILHVYYNKHFSKTRQYASFLDVIEEAEFEIRSYAKILLTDCEYEKSDENMACREIKRMNENRMIIGYQPNSKFTSFGDKVMQAPPSNKVFDQISDSYTAQQIVRFTSQLVPNFFKQLKNTHQFESFKTPKYVPKLIFAAQQGYIPEVIKQLGVEFFLKFDMAWVEDLTESIINSLEVTKFPSLLVLKHNFENNKLEIFAYPSHDFSQDRADNIRRFLSSHALKQKRNDYVFHLISNPPEAQIQTVDSKAELDRTLDMIKSWVFVQQGVTNQKLMQLKDKYGLFYDYVHYLNPSTESKITLINTRAGFELDYGSGGIQYRTLNAEDLHSNMTIWLKKDYVVMGVREQYGYLCTIIDKPLFAGMAQCFIIEEDEYEKVAQNVRIKFKYGFVVSAKNQVNGTSKVNGNDIRTLDYQEIYRTLEYITKLKVRDIIDDFIEHPVKDLAGSTEVQELCAEPYKKCILYFYEPSNDKTKLQYLELEAVDFVNEYKIYAIDLTCNKNMYEEIPQFKQSHGGLIAFHPRHNKYVYLKAKMTRNVIRKFLEINNSDKKALPFKQFLSDRTALHDCRDPISQQETSPQSRATQEQRFAQEL